jgi:hypothetical protein
MLAAVAERGLLAGTIERCCIVALRSDLLV